VPPFIFPPPQQSPLEQRYRSRLTNPSPPPFSVADSSWQRPSSEEQNFTGLTPSDVPSQSPLPPISTPSIVARNVTDLDTAPRTVSISTAETVSTTNRDISPPRALFDDRSNDSVNPVETSAMSILIASSNDATDAENLIDSAPSSVNQQESIGRQTIRILRRRQTGLLSPLSKIQKRDGTPPPPS